MLVYFGTGPRRYHEEPIRIFERHAWSFQIVLKGEIALLTPEGPDLLRSRFLWLSRPDFAHGWTGARGKVSEVAVFHFPYLPEDLLRAFPEDQPVLEMALSPGQCQRISVLAGQVRRYWIHPLPGRILCFQNALYELSLLVFEGMVTSSASGPRSRPARKVTAALKWFGARIEQNPSLREVAEAVGSSTAQLRRDFLGTLKMNPKETFDEIRLKHALESLYCSDEPVERISEQCGFWSASAFSRAFKAKFGRSPREVRQRAFRKKRLAPEIDSH